MRFRVATTLLMITLPMILVPAGALADGPQGRTIAQLEKHVSRLEAHQNRLELLLKDQALRVSRLKHQPSGMTRDLQLRSALRASQQIADRLTRMQTEIRRASEALRARYRAALDAATPPLSVTRRKQLIRRYIALDRKLRAPTVIADVHGDPSDSPDDLEEKADLLDDSAEKVERELRFVQRRLARYETRRKLQRHRRTADQSLFVEDAGRRIIARVEKSQSTAADRSGTVPETTLAPSSDKGTTNDTQATDTQAGQTYNDGTSDDAVPAFSGTGDSSVASSESVGDSTAGTVDTGDVANSVDTGSVANTVPDATSATPTQPVARFGAALDPSTYLELRNTLRGPSGASYGALKSAEKKMEAIAKQLAARAKNLREKAKKLRTGRKQ